MLTDQQLEEIQKRAMHLGWESNDLENLLRDRRELVYALYEARQVSDRLRANAETTTGVSVLLGSQHCYQDAVVAIALAQQRDPLPPRQELAQVIDKAAAAAGTMAEHYREGSSSHHLWQSIKNSWAEYAGGIRDESSYEYGDLLGEE